ncbi:ionic transporter y4hA [Dyadobacter chenwenxiniae]|uniref:Ionic transporter y4hA n=1 Tax=Dyadobacter chenwenxiniae TaxID=2906456 RepID=A0A9X1PQF0_9BACT|nr:ionic transporter y4hA [Dyadobacter chenwenxiniae]MCF0054113.1 ionic transporter y4hA [Dyadobacter chenwenxiniae]MCF0064595.1 ionic transporter y4hA [Dyadobacter chenwenxiniae]UON84347.1 ionic transporter y4hA [Dyadobacter chenwenxiniae]
MKKIFQWSYIAPVIAWAFYLVLPIGTGLLVNLLAVAALIGGVFSAVHHAEVVAHKVGEPYGTIILAVAVTLLEASIIVSLMLTGGAGADTYARDTLFAAVMLILNGILGISMFVGAMKFKEQSFETKSVTIALVSLVSILVLTLVLPNFTTSIAGPSYSTPQLIAIGICCLVIYGSFIFTQTVRHRKYFLAEVSGQEKDVTGREALISLFFLLVCLGVVIALAKDLSPVIEAGIVAAGLPTALVGVAIAAVILLPEGIAAIRAARRGQYQTSINLALGSALASIGLSIPTVVIVCTIMDLPLILGLTMKSMVLLVLSIFTVMLSLNKGQTNSLYAIVLLVNLMMYIFTVVFP